jgi:flagellar assembly factor FliW
MKDNDDIYYFAQGIPGFEDYKEFRFIEDREIPFAHLIAVEEERIAFILMQPGLLFPDYGVEVDAEFQEILKLRQAQDEAINSGTLHDESLNFNVEIWTIVTLNREDAAQSTVNLRAPILLNTEHKVGVQVILTDERYLTKHPMKSEDSLGKGQEGAVG